LETESACAQTGKSGTESDASQWPTPDDYGDPNEGRVEGGIVKIFIPLDTVPRAKPEWWTEAWDHLVGEPASIGYIEPVCPKDFKYEVHGDIEAFDHPGYETVVNSETGEVIAAG
jgi:hypothetical protein